MRPAYACEGRGGGGWLEKTGAVAGGDLVRRGTGASMRQRRPGAPMLRLDSFFRQRQMRFDVNTHFVC